MRQKKIHIINRYFHPVTAGIETCMLESYPRLVKKGWDITVHTSKNTLTQRNVLTSEAVVKGVKVKRYSYGKFSFFPQIPYNKIDIIVINNFDVFPHLSVLSKILFLKATGRKNFSLVLAPHGGFTPNWGSFSPKARIVKKIYHSTLGSLLVNLTVDVVHSVSIWEKEELIVHGIRPDLIQVVTNGVESKAFKKYLNPSSTTREFVKKNTPYIMQLGRIHPIKNNNAAINALSKMPEYIKLLIVGPIHDASYKKSLDKLVIKLQLEHRVHFMGGIYKGDKYFLLRNAEALVQLSSVEAGSITILEALSQGLICVVSKHPALTNVIKNEVNGYNYEINDYKNIALKLTNIIQNKDSAEFKQMRELNRKTARCMTWEKVATNMDLMYKKLEQAKKPNLLHLFDVGRGLIVSIRGFLL